MRMALATGLVAAVLGSACSSDEGDAASSADVGFDLAEEAGVDAMSDGEVAMAPGQATAGSSTAARTAAGDAAVDEAVALDAGPADATAGRALARTARLELRVDDVEQSAARIRAMATRLGGFVADAEVRGGDHAYGVLTLRLPATNLDAAVGELGELATEVTLQQIGTEDLTDQLTDTATRIENLSALEAELRALMAEIRERTSSAQELLVVFNQVNDVRFQIEQLEARRAAIVDRVALATVTIDLQPVPAATTVDQVAEPSTAAQAWAATRAAFGRMGDAAIWFGLTILPIGLAVLVPTALALTALWRLLPRRRDGEPLAAPARPATAD